MAKKILHPLRTWLDANRMSVVDFAERHGIKWRTLYNQLEGVPTTPRRKIMFQIQRGTKGAVTIMAQYEWFERRAK